MNRLRRGAKVAGCALLWLAAGLSILLEGLMAVQLVSLERELARFGRAENPYVAEDAEILGSLVLLNLLPMLLLLGFALYCTYKLRRKKGTPCTPNT